MLDSLHAISAYRQGDFSLLENNEWLKRIVSAEERIVNLERITSIGELTKANPVLDYTERTLRVLNDLPVSFWIRELLEEVLAWSETAKGGTLRERIQWQESGVNLFVHNLGSGELYARYIQERYGQMSLRHKVVHTLIMTHGLVGQYIRGEVRFHENYALTELVTAGYLTSEELIRLLLPLNQCIMSGVSESLWKAAKIETEEIIAAIAEGREPKEWNYAHRLERLRTGSIRQGEAFHSEISHIASETNLSAALAPMDHLTLWFVEAALQDFSVDEFVKVLMISLHGQIERQDRDADTEYDSVTSRAERSQRDEIHHLSFEPLMNEMYYDYKGVKKLNVYKKRMIEQYLHQLDWDACLEGGAGSNPHLRYRLDQKNGLEDTVFFTFEFSRAAERLIEFCIEAEKSPLYEKAVLMLFDLFGLRRDAYDRFHNEEAYLQDMNSSGDYKSVILDYITGSRAVDIGPGGGILLDLIEEKLPHVHAVGIDISSNVIEALEKRKRLEGRSWDVVKGDALKLREELGPESVDTVIFSSILHELYSYIEYEGFRFNPATVRAALRSAYDVLSPGGRIIIRDGIMTEPVDQLRRIRFLEEDGMLWLSRYAEDFNGRKITYEALNDHEVLMPVNDAMEFLYTYTWGEESYVHEVQEQFGYFTPSQYEAVIREVLGDAEIVTSKHFLQEGYTEALAGRIEFADESGTLISLPDSTCLIVIEKPLASGVQQ
ncbi:class I SAM-dependent methyltransferase [Paenibacillus dakarensis]|uniref:class I SAM-dependent methyltransferase n=1 Tax=Paenibacillus dakarensis TaxID=1527293 RepID=UPI0006D5459F|nr:class I SAM-dependent methyltransferase [Paenibacillus dakarensis]